MGRRNDFLPKAAPDFCLFVTIATFIPICAVFELVEVMPSFHDSSSVIYIGSRILGLFVCFNIYANLFACMSEDTSIQSLMLRPREESEKSLNWRTCDRCQVRAPPRSWHCDTCGTCILKRDHHCVFTGYCIGHRNHRFFYMFIVYTLIGNLYSIVYTSAYLWWLNADEYLNVYTFVKMICPLLGFFSRLSFPCLYLAIYEMNIALFIYTLMILRFHVVNTLRGAVIYDRHTDKYNLGWKQNLLMVFGRRWYLIWLSPFVRSELPHDGVDWEPFHEEYSQKML